MDADFNRVIGCNHDERPNYAGFYGPFVKRKDDGMLLDEITQRIGYPSDLVLEHGGTG